MSVGRLYFSFQWLANIKRKSGNLSEKEGRCSKNMLESVSMAGISDPSRNSIEFSRHGVMVVMSFAIFCELRLSFDQTAAAVV